MYAGPDTWYYTGQLGKVSTMWNRARATADIKNEKNTRNSKTEINKH